MLLSTCSTSLSRYRGQDPFCDPFCGSGTIPIEAALIAKNRAPGLRPQLRRPEVGLPAVRGVDGMRRTRPWTRSSTDSTTSGAAISTPAPWHIARDNAAKAGVED
ncbi:MAG: hypothetical protein ACLU38_01425 [Dysosmobacter sp.]